MRVGWGSIVAAAWLTATGPAVRAEPLFRSDFHRACVDGRDWRLSARLAGEASGDRLRCLDDTDGRALSITVRPGDAYDPNPGGGRPTERVEVQLRRELVRFDRPIWYSFRFKPMAPWLDGPNRTVIHQIKQNIDPLYEKGRGGQEICDAANPLFKIEVDSDGKGLVLRAKVAGSQDCGDSRGQQTICGDWPIEAGRWHRVQVALRPSQQASQGRVRLWLDGKACATFTGLLGYPTYGVRRDGQPVIDTQPRFGIYRDALPDREQTILFDDIAFWGDQPKDEAGWTGLDAAP